MSKSSVLPAPARRMTAARRSLLCGAALWLAGCAVEFQNRQASQELAQLARPPGSVYTGWRVFEDKCAGCHGAAAAGTSLAPDLLPRVRGMSSRQFADVLLTRYEWSVPPAQPSSPSTERDAFIDDLVQRKKGALTMPAWQGEPRVTAHIIDLYDYLSARAEGTQGPGRPAQ